MYEEAKPIWKVVLSNLIATLLRFLIGLVEYVFYFVEFVSIMHVALSMSSS